MTDANQKRDETLRNYLAQYQVFFDNFVDALVTDEEIDAEAINALNVKMDSLNDFKNDFHNFVVDRTLVEFQEEDEDSSSLVLRFRR